MKRKKIGNFGERIAEKYLQKKGYQILDKNYSPQFLSGPKKGEIDIVAKKGEIISFIEVKTLSGWGSTASLRSAVERNSATSSFSPEKKVDFGKQRKIIKIAQSWLMKNQIPLEAKWQIDVMAIKIDFTSKKAKIRHFQNAIY